MQTEVTNIINDLLKHLAIQNEGVDYKEHELLNRPVFIVKTKESGMLIGQTGENFSALNHLVKKLAAKKLVDENLKFSVDVNDYQESLLNRLKDKVRIMADRAVSFKNPVELDPMSSFERMLVHTILEPAPNVVTESTGFGKTRRVVIKYVESNTGSESNTDSENDL